VSRHFGGNIPGVFSAAGVSRYAGAFAFSVARAVATFPTRGDTNLRSIDCAWDTNKGPATAITNKGLVIDIGLQGLDCACSGTMKLNYKRKIPDEVLHKLPTTTLRFPVEPVFVYRAAGVRPKS
jgi:hypothetical protein